MSGKKNKMKILIIGTGNYVTGRGTKDQGTILPAIYEFNKKYKKVNEVIILATNKKSAKLAEIKNKQIRHLSGSHIKVIIKVDNGKNLNYLKNIKNLNNHILCAIIATPDHTHYKLTKSCLNNGYHSLVVKPLVTKLFELKNLIKLCEKNKLYGAVEFHKRFDRQALILKDKFNLGIIGKPLYSYTEYSQRKIVPEIFFKKWITKTNVFQYLGIHYIDLIRYITNATPKRVMAISQNSYLRKRGINNSDSIQAIVEWQTSNKSIFTQTLLLNWIDPKNTTAMSDQNFKFIGTKGRFEADQKNRGLRVIEEKNNIEDINPDFCRKFGTKPGNISWAGYGIESITTFLEDVSMVNKDRKYINYLETIRPTFKEAIYSTTVLEAINYSLKNNSAWKKIKF